MRYLSSLFSRRSIMAHSLLVSCSLVQAAEIAYPCIGKVALRTANEIGGSNWSVGCETMDRNYTVFENYKAYLGDFGAKKGRVQGGWARCETTAGVYSWGWLDSIVDGMTSLGVEPWIETSYGNSVYPNGGTTGLGGLLPTGDAALAAWDNWVRALVLRYKDRVHCWEIWNEPDLGGRNTTKDYAKFYLRTVRIIRTADPQSTLYAGAFSGIGSETLDDFFGVLRDSSSVNLVDVITFHGYPQNPDGLYGSLSGWRTKIAGYAPNVKLMQGESGAPSTNVTFGALSGSGFTETKQAKWDLRRMLGDLGHDIQSNLFTICEAAYSSGVNTKGLLKIYGPDDKRVQYPKPAYHACRNVTSVFDNLLTRIPQYPYTRTGSSAALALYAYANAGTGKQIVTVWSSGVNCSDANDKTLMSLTFSNGAFDDPVYVDLRSGFVYDIPDGAWHRSGDAYTFSNVPVYDSPIMIADRSTFAINPDTTGGGGVVVPVPADSNLALGKPVTASHATAAGIASNLVDGNSSTLWSSDQGYPQWAEIDLGRIYQLRRFDVMPNADRAYRYVIEVKADASDIYQVVVDRTTNTQSSSSLLDSIAPTTARFVQIRVMSAYEYTGLWVAIKELRVYGNEPATPLKRIKRTGSSLPQTDRPHLLVNLARESASIGRNAFEVDGRRVACERRAWVGARIRALR